MTEPTTLQRAILKADGTIVPLDRPATFEDITKVLGGALPNFIHLRDGRMLMCDDNGRARGLPHNVQATALYHSICRPGTTSPVVGDCLLALEADFEHPEDY